MNLVKQYTSVKSYVRVNCNLIDYFNSNMVLNKVKLYRLYFLNCLINDNIRALTFDGLQIDLLLLFADETVQFFNTYSTEGL